MVASITTGKVRASSGKREPKPQSPIDKAHAREVVWDQVGPLFEAARRITNPSFVYVIGEGDAGPVKIGLAKDPIKRLRQMQTGNPRRLRVDWVVVGDQLVEQLLHEMWEPSAIRSIKKIGKSDSLPTEWFLEGIRYELDEAMESARDLQIDYLQVGVEQDFSEMGRLVLKAHREVGVDIHQREEQRLLAHGAGYVVRNRSTVAVFNRLEPPNSAASGGDV